MSKPEHRSDEPDDATTELPKVPDTSDLAADPLDPASLAWSSGSSLPASDAVPTSDRSRVPGAPTSELTDVSFPTAWRGYEPTAVDAYVRQVTRTIADLEGNRSPAEAVRRALDRVGEETSSILHEAEQTAERMTEKSRKQSSERLQRAEREADEITLAARTRLRQLDADVDRIWLERQRLIDDTRRLAERLEQIADQAEERFPAEDEETNTDDTATTVSDRRRPPRDADETVRFAPPGVIDPEPAAGADALHVGPTGDEPSLFDAEREIPEAGVDHQVQPETGQVGGDVPGAASPWPTPAAASDRAGHADEPGGAGGEAVGESSAWQHAAEGEVLSPSTWSEPAGEPAQPPAAGPWSAPAEGEDHAPEGGEDEGRHGSGEGESESDKPIISWSTPDAEQQQQHAAEQHAADDPSHREHGG